ncbi:SPOCS domain-containing protein [Clostridium tarantellae]|uniref:DUF3794 domain-containing protein n=1 Tax=Clostridium tarantellae TaxID=39493 RepID=A0A6I1MFW7_9CLOT|nr:SPOCS domain-containing protein [Clostridium tarantellae]MPQ42426.1 DUF3794 domain-containing protein [Clostridium tarantellae]
MNKNKENSPKAYYYNDKLCTKLEFKNTISLPCKKPKIKYLKKISINPYITNTKTVELSMNIDPNNKKLSLTAKRLLIEGYLEATFIYIFCELNESVCSVNFKIPFHTYINLDDSSNIYLDKYTVKPFIKNICAKSIDCKNICLNFNLFLLANKKALPPPIKKLPNSIIINNINNNEVAKIEFNVTNKKFIVTSTGEIPNATLGAQEYFIIQLRNINTGRVIMRTQILANENANNFVIDLNNLNFSFDDNFIQLDYLVPPSINITNFPKLGETHIPNSPREFYRITPNGLIAYIPPEPPVPPPPTINKLPNTIIVNNRGTSSQTPITTIEFDSDNKKFLVIPTAILMNSNGNFSFKLKDGNNERIKASSTILSNTNSFNFANTLSHQIFEYNDVLEIDYSPSVELIVTNFPDSGQTYRPSTIKELFRITPDGLIAYIPPEPPVPPPPTINKLPNTIIVDNRTSSSQIPITLIEFDSDNKKLLVIPTDTLMNATGNFSFKLKDSNNQTIKTSSTIANNTTSRNFANALNGSSFEYNDILEIDFSPSVELIVTNFPTSGQTYKPTTIKEFFRITPNGLIVYVPPTPPPPPPTINKLPNTIIINGNFGAEVAKIEFDSDKTSFIITSTGEIPDPTMRDTTYFSLKLKSLNDQRIKIQDIIKTNESANNFAIRLNGQTFNYTDILEIEYLAPNNITITNYPSTGQIHRPSNKKEYFQITSTGLIPYTPPSVGITNKIIILNDDGDDVSTIEFDSSSKKFKVTSTTEIPDVTQGATPYFTLKLKDKATNTTKINAFIPSNITANNFRDSLNNFGFEFTDYLELDYFEPANIIITNYPTKGNDYIATNNKEYYSITPQGLVSYIPIPPPIPPTIPPPPTINKLPNTIIVDNRRNTGSVITLIDFDSDNKKLIILPTDTLMNSTGTFSFKLKDSNNQIVKASSTIVSNTNSRNFANTLNGKVFEYDDILEIDFSSSLEVIVTNFPTSGKNFIPQTLKSFFRITPNGLIAYVPPTPPPPPPTINKLPNTIIINGNFGAEIAKIEFDSDKTSFIITSTGEVPDPTMGNTTYFSLKLKSLNDQRIKIQDIIKTNESANNFASKLNNQIFSYTDILELEYLVPNNITITNYPSTGQVYKPSNKKEYFQITSTGLIPYTPPSVGITNKIIILNDDGDDVSTIEFDSSSKKFKVTSTTEIPDVTQGATPYFTFKLKDKATNTTKINTFIPSNITANNFRDSLNNFDFEFTDYLELDYFEPSNITITDYPTRGRDHIPTNDKEYYSITPTGLVAYIPPTPPSTVMNSKIKLYIRNTGSPNNLEEVASIELNKTTSQFVVTSIDKTISLGLPEYFNFTRLNSSGTILDNVSINNSDNITKLNILNNKPFSSGNIVSLRYVNKDLVKVENIKSAPSYMLKDSKDLFKIENGELTPYTPVLLPNIITFTDSITSPVGSISFNTTLRILTVFFTISQVSSTFANDDYFTVRLKNSAGALKGEKIIKGKDNFSEIAIVFDNSKFEYGDILELIYKETNKVSISNFGSTGTTFIAPRNSSSYIITPTGLQLLPNTLKNTITFTGANNEQISTISFNIDNNNLIVTSTGQIANQSIGGNKAFGIELIDPFSTVKLASSVKGNENANNFKSTLNNKPFMIGDIILLEYADKSKVSISNYPNDGTNYTPIKNMEESFLITSNGLVKVNILPNIILVKNTDDSNLFYILFDTINKRLIVKDTGTTTRPSGPTKVPYYILIELKYSNGLLKSYGYLKPSGDNSSIITTALNGKPFDFRDIINLTYINEKKVFITNMPTVTPNPQKLGQGFIITENGLQANASGITKNTIIVKGDADAEIVDIKFPMPGPKLDLDDKGGKVPSQFFGEEYFKLTLNRFNTNVKTESSLIFTSASDTPDDFIDPLQNEDVYFESLITLNYKESNRVQVTNVNIPASFTKPRAFTETFIVTLDGLKLADNTIKFLDASNITVAIMTFNHVNKRVMIWGDTRAINNNSPFNTQEYFAIEIKNSTGAITSSSSAQGQSFASNLETGLNYEPFNYGDTLTLKYKENQKISISNYPARGSYVYSPETTNTEESFKITAFGLIPNNNIIRNIIMVLDGDNILATIMFNKDTKKIIAYSTGKTASNKTPANYFKIVLKNGNTVVAQTNLLANESANKVKVDLNDKDFDTGYIIEITAIPNTLLVANYTNVTDRFTTISPLKTMFLEITAQALVPYNPPATFLDNVINFRSANNTSDAATIKFDIATNRLNVVADGMTVEASDKFDFILKSNTGSEKIKASINGGENGNTFASTLTDASFEIGDKVELGTVDRSRALIKNLPIPPNEYFSPGSPETFTIAADGLKFASTSPLSTAQVLPQRIAVQGKINATVTDILATVYFDNNSKKLIAYSTGKTIVSSTETGEYFALVIKDSSDNEIKTGIINIGENANKFATDLNGFAFQDNYIITIRINQNA